MKGKIIFPWWLVSMALFAAVMLTSNLALAYVFAFVSTVGGIPACFYALWLLSKEVRDAIAGPDGEGEG